jgi:hypothetical protein
MSLDKVVKEVVWLHGFLVIWAFSKLIVLSFVIVKVWFTLQKVKIFMREPSTLMCAIYLFSLMWRKKVSILRKLTQTTTQARQICQPSWSRRPSLSIAWTWLILVLARASSMWIFGGGEFVTYWFVHSSWSIWRLSVWHHESWCIWYVSQLPRIEVENCDV